MHTLEAHLLDPVIGSLIVIGIALLFAVAGIHKLRNLAVFTEVFVAYRVMPESAGRRLAWLIPCIELGVAAALLWVPCRPWAIIAAMSLLFGYASGLGVNLARGRRELDCGCGTAGNRRSIAAWMIWRNLFLVLALAIAAIPWAARPFDGFDLLTVVGGLTALVALYVAVDQLLGDVAPKALAFSRRTS
jgi:hypothetical protein